MLQNYNDFQKTSNKQTFLESGFNRNEAQPLFGFTKKDEVKHKIKQQECLIQLRKPHNFS